MHIVKIIYQYINLYLMVSENRKKQNKEAIWWDFGKSLNALEIRRFFFLNFTFYFIEEGVAHWVKNKVHSTLIE